MLNKLEELLESPNRNGYIMIAVTPYNKDNIKDGVVYNHAYTILNV